MRTVGQNTAANIAYPSTASHRQSQIAFVALHVEPGGFEQLVVRGDTTARELAAFWLHSRGVLVGMKVDTWDGIDPTTRLIRSRADRPCAVRRS
jgi:hypothetical protein